MSVWIQNDNLKRAFELLKAGDHTASDFLDKACEEGDAQALFVKADALEHGGFFMDKDSVKSEKYMIKAVQAGSTWAMCFSFHPRQYLAQIECARDDFTLALRFYLGIGIKENDKCALDYLRMAAQSGNIIAQTMMYAWTLPAFEQEKVEWLTKAAQAGYGYAQFYLGLHCKVELNDINVSLFWFRRGAIRKDRRCISMIENM